MVPTIAGIRELLIHDISTQLKSVTLVEGYFKEIFYELSHVQKENYTFSVSRSKFIYYKGKYSILIRFADIYAAKFYYFSLLMHKIRHNNLFGESYKAF